MLGVAKFFRSLFPLALASCVLLCGVAASAQQLIFNNIPLNNALPSNETYHVFQDRKGYMWIATEQGLCRLDGQEVKVYNEKNGLAEKAIYAVKEHKGVIWLVSSKNRILLLKDGKLTEHPLSKKYQQMIPASDEFTYDIHFSKQIVINTKASSYILDTLANTITKVATAKTSSSIQVNTDGFLPYTALINWTIKDMTLIPNFPGKSNKVIKIPFNGAWGYRYSVGKINTTYYFAYNKQLVKFNGDQSVETYTMPENISCMFVDKDQDLWIGMYKKGLRYYPKGEIKDPVSSLTGLSIASIVQDREKNIWCTTLECGVFMARNKRVISYAEKLGNTYPQSLVKAIGNKTYILKGQSLFGIDSAGKLREEHTPAGSFAKELTNLVKQHRVLFRTLEMADFIHYGKNIFYTISYVNLHRIDHDKVTKYLLPMPGRCIAYLNHRVLLVGCNDGVYEFDTRDTLWKKVVTTPSRVTKIFVTAQKECLVATNGSGVYSLKGGKLLPFVLPAEIVYDIAQDPKGNLWFATNKGVIKKERSSRVSVYTVLNGLPANAVAKLAVNNGQLYLNTSAGLVTFPLDSEMLNKEKMPIFLSSAIAGNTTIDFNRPMKLAYDHNTLALQIDALSFKNSKAKLKYRLSPGDNTFRLTGSNQIVLENLAPSVYTLTVYGMNSDGFVSKPLVLTFQIEHPFWQRWWFIIGAVMLILFIIVLVVKSILYRMRKKEEEKTSIHKLIAESRLAALQAQMNPHFVFNSINSIQNYILQQQHDEACDYLARFSQLIRLVLQHSESRYISLADELKLLDLYVSLEQLRFGESFDYHTVIDPAIGLHQVNLPSMLIQPYLENAIWHGLMPLKSARRGRLSLEIGQTTSHLMISVIDNGIGRQKSMDYKSRDLHRPMALKLNQQRINTLNVMLKKEIFKVEIVDNYEQSGQPSGTTVTILMPLDYA